MKQAVTAKPQISFRQRVISDVKMYEASIVISVSLLIADYKSLDEVPAYIANINISLPSETSYSLHRAHLVSV